MEWLYAVISASGGSVLTGLIITYLLKRQLESDAQERRDLKYKLETLETQKMQAIEKLIANTEKNLAEHIAEDKSQQILTEIKNMSASISKLSDMTSRALEINAQQQAQLKAHDLYLANIDGAQKEHIRVFHRRGQ